MCKEALLKELLNQHKVFQVPYILFYFCTLINAHCIWVSPKNVPIYRHSLQSYGAINQAATSASTHFKRTFKVPLALSHTCRFEQREVLNGIHIVTTYVQWMTKVREVAKIFLVRHPTASMRTNWLNIWCVNSCSIDPLWVYISVTSTHIMKHAISIRWLANLNLKVSNFPHNFWRSYEYLIRCQSKLSRAH